MAGLLDWLDNALGGQMGGSSPPVQQTGMDQPKLPDLSTSDIGGGMTPGQSPPPYPQGTDPMTAGQKPPTPDPMATQPMPPAQPLDAPPIPPFAQGGDPMAGTGTPPAPLPQGGDPMAGTGSGNDGGLSQPPVPLPMARPAGAPGAVPTMAPPPTPPAAGNGPPMNLAPQGTPMSPAEGNRIYDNYKAAGGGGPVNIVGGSGYVAPGSGPGYAPDQQGRGGILSKALGLSPDQSNQLRAGIGAGLTAAGNSAGKSPFQALTSGAGATLEGGDKERHANTKEAQGYLDKAIASKKAGDDASYKTNYMQYLAAKLKSDQEKTASKDAAANKNDSPTQLYLSSQRLVQPERNALNKQLQQMQKDGAPADQIAKAKADGEAAINGKLQEHFSAVGIHPQTAAQIAQQPGNSQANPIDGKKMGLTPETIKKLQPGQYYTNPADGKVYQYNGPKDTKGKSAPSKPSKPEPADPMKPEKGARMSMAGAGADDDE